MADKERYDRGAFSFLYYVNLNTKDMIIKRIILNDTHKHVIEEVNLLHYFQGNQRFLQMHFCVYLPPQEKENGTVFVFNEKLYANMARGRVEFLEKKSPN